MRTPFDVSPQPETKKNFFELPPADQETYIKTLLKKVDIEKGNPDAWREFAFDSHYGEEYSYIPSHYNTIAEYLPLYNDLNNTLNRATRSDSDFSKNIADFTDLAKFWIKHEANTKQFQPSTSISEPILLFETMTKLIKKIEQQVNEVRAKGEGTKDNLPDNFVTTDLTKETYLLQIAEHDNTTWGPIRPYFTDWLNMTKNLQNVRLKTYKASLDNYIATLTSIINNTIQDNTFLTNFDISLEKKTEIDQLPFWKKIEKMINEINSFIERNEILMQLESPLLFEQINQLIEQLGNQLFRSSLVIEPQPDGNQDEYYTISPSTAKDKIRTQLRNWSIVELLKPTINGFTQSTQQ